MLPEKGAGGTQRATTPEQKPLEEAGDSTREMPVLQTQRTKDCQTLPSFSCDLFSSFSAHFTSYISFASSGEEGRGSTNRLQGETKVSDAGVFSQLILCSLSTDW